MFDQLMSPDLPNQLYADLVRARGRERLAHRLARELRRARNQTRRAAVGPDELRPDPASLKIYCSPRQA